MAAARGTAAHNSAEYVLKTAQRLARATAQKRNSGAFQKMAFIEHQKQSQNGRWKKPFKGPRVAWSASVLLRAPRLDLDHVTAIHSVEFIAFHPAGFAGAVMLSPT